MSRAADRCQHAWRAAQDVGDARAAQTATVGIEKQRPITPSSFREPCVKGIDRSCPQGAGALLTTLALERGDGYGIEAQISDIEPDDFLDPSPGVVEEQKQRQVTVSGSGGGVHQSEDLVFVEVLDFWMLKVCGSQLPESAAALQVLGGDGGDVASEGFQSSEAVIARARTAAALLLEAIRERSGRLPRRGRQSRARRPYSRSVGRRDPRRA